MNDVLEPPDEPGQSSPAVDQGLPLRHPPAVPPVDVAAYSAFYRAEIKALVNFLLWMGASATGAADLAQETMIETYRNWPSIQHPRAWVRRVASRKFARRHIDRDERSVDRADDRNPLLKAPDDIVLWEQRHEVLRLLASLPWRQRQVMAWSFDGYQPQEIAVELNITPEAVRASLKLARRTLATRLAQAGEPA